VGLKSEHHLENVGDIKEFDVDALRDIERQVRKVIKDSSNSIRPDCISQ